MWYGIILAIGLILAAIGLYLFKNSLGFIRNSERATGTVINLEPVRDNDGTTYRAIFTFKTMANREVVYRQNGSSSPAGWRVGETAQFAYRSDNPEAAKLLTYWGSFLGTVILLALAMPLIVIGGGYFFAQQFLK
ncbi:MAG: DUF3592 domain-containing protein [Chitinophagaceae bacterium]|nr:MAG: DUF3592 domain-containing protein [Chitinophagaceae bacterium]